MGSFEDNVEQNEPEEKIGCEKLRVLKQNMDVLGIDSKSCIPGRYSYMDCPVVLCCSRFTFLFSEFIRKFGFLLQFMFSHFFFNNAYIIFWQHSVKVDRQWRGAYPFI